MEQAFEREKALKNVRPSSSQAPGEFNSEESEEDRISKEQFESLQKQIESMSTKLDEYHLESSRRSTEMEQKMDEYHIESSRRSAEIERKVDDLMGYLHGRFPPNE